MRGTIAWRFKLLHLDSNCPPRSYERQESDSVLTRGGFWRRLPPSDRLLVTTLGPFGRAACTVVFIYLLELIALLFAPETKGQCLPD